MDVFASIAIPSKLDLVEVLGFGKGPMKLSQCGYLEIAVDLPAIKHSYHYGV